MTKPELKRATLMNTLRTLRLALALLIGLSVAPGASADDLDIFLGLSGGSADAPNVMVLIDNGPNWSRQSGLDRPRWRQDHAGRGGTAGSAPGAHLFQHPEPTRSRQPRPRDAHPQQRRRLDRRRLHPLRRA